VPTWLKSSQTKISKGRLQVFRTIINGYDLSLWKPKERSKECFRTTGTSKLKRQLTNKNFVN
jgi:hypothetical protein